MSAVSIVVIAVLAVALIALAVVHFAGRQRRPAPSATPRARRILFPFMAEALSRSALDAALRLAIAEDATLVAVFLARVPMYMPLDSALPRQSQVCLPLQEAIEQVATRAGVPVDLRVERGRTYRHALQQAILHERFDRVVVAAAAEGNPGFDAEDVAWLLNNSPGEIVVLRPQPGARRNGHVVNREYETAGSR